MDMSWSKLQEMVKVREAWRAAVHGFTKSWTWLSDWTTTSRVSEIQLNSKTISLEVESDSTDKRLSPTRLVSTSDISCKPGLLPVLLTNELQIRFQQSFLLFRMPTESPDCYLYSWLDINQRSPTPPSLGSINFLGQLTELRKTYLPSNYQFMTKDVKEYKLTTRRRET